MTDTVQFSSPELAQLADEWKLTYKLSLPDKCRIVVAGAFEGRVMRLLAELYPQHEWIVGFEPQVWAASSCFEKVKQYPAMIVNQSGLLCEKVEGLVVRSIGEYGTDAASILGAPREQGVGLFANAYVQLDSLAPIDLFVMNMEGYEYRLLPYLARRGPAYIKKFAVQFHVQYEISKIHTSNMLSDMAERYGPSTFNDWPKWMMWG